MSHNNILTSVESNANSQLRSLINLAKFDRNAYWQFATFLSLAIVMQAFGFNRATASSLNSSIVQQTSKVSSSNSSPQRQPGFLPRIFNLIVSSTKLQPINVQSATPQPAPVLNLAPLQPIADRKLYLADAKSLSKPEPLIHRVKQGETITAIASDYRVSSNDLVKINSLDNSNVIFVDQRLTIPVSNKSIDINAPASAIANLAPVESRKADPIELLQPSPEDPYIAKLKQEIEQRRAQYRQEQASKLSAKDSEPSLISAAETSDLESQPQVQITQPEAKPDSSTARRNLKSHADIQDSFTLVLPPLPNSEEYLPSAFDGYAWPAQGVLTSGYGWRWGRLHRGIDIAAPIGTPIVAAAAGEVVGAGWHGGYGNLIKLEHLDGSLTYYAHNNRILVTHGQKVRQGEQIAEMGSTGHSTGSHLHFEIHLRDKKVADPLALLGSR